MADPHVGHEALVAQWAGELTAAEADAIDEHVFGCDACAAAAERLAVLITGVRAVIPDILSHEVRDRLIAAGVKVVSNPTVADVEVRAQIPPDAELFVHVLRTDLRGTERVDIDVTTPDDVPLLAFQDVPFDPGSGEILAACRQHFRGHFPDAARFRVYAVEGEERRHLADFNVLHVWL